LIRPAPLAAALTCILLAGCGGGSNDDRAGELIAFVKDREGGADIFAIGADGTGESAITSDGAVGYVSPYVPPSPPSWSPDGTRIAFERPSDESTDIWMAGADGSEARVVVRDAGFPAWSPTGEEIAFTRVTAGTADVWTVRPDGSAARVLVHNAWLSAWSPGAGRLVFVRKSEDDTHLWIVSLDDGAETQLTDGPGGDLLPAWAPAERIAFVRYLDNSEIFVIDPDGKNELRLTDDLAEDSSPTWSPDGRQVAFTNDLTYTKEWRKGAEVFVMAADGSGRTRLTHNDVPDVAPSWQPAED
jgi:TolB protein